MQALIVGVAGSLIAAFLIAVASAVFSRKARAALSSKALSLLGANVVRVYDRSRASESDLSAALETASNVRAIMGRGNALKREVFRPLLDGAPVGGDLSFRLLLPVTRKPYREVDWTAVRQQELAPIDNAVGVDPEHTRKEITANVDYLKAHIDDGRVEVGFFNIPHIGRVVITDQEAFFNPYKDRTHGRDSPMLRIRASSPLYEALDRLFEQLWAHRSHYERRSTS